MKRRRWIELVISAAWIGGIAWVVNSFMRRTSGIRMQLRKIVVGREDELRQRRFLQVEINGRTVHISTSRDRLAALDLRCTHGNCTVRYAPTQQQFVCPCHGGVFDAEGRVISGPPTKPLAQVPLRCEEGIVYILDHT